MYASGRRSGREDSNCPSLMYVVPSSSRAARNDRAPSRVASRRPRTPISARTRRIPLRRATRPTTNARRVRSMRSPTKRVYDPVCRRGNATAPWPTRPGNCSGGSKLDPPPHACRHRLARRRRRDRPSDRPAVYQKPPSLNPIGLKQKPRICATEIARIMRERNRALVTSCTSFPNLEPDVLESLCRSAVEVRCKPVVAALLREIAAGNPCGRAMAGRPELGKVSLGRCECCFRIVEAVLLEKRAPEHELRIPDLVEVILVARLLEEHERVPGLLFCLVDAAGAQMDL